MRTFKVCPPLGLWNAASDDGGNSTYFSTEVTNETTLSRGCLSPDYFYPWSHLYRLDTIGYPILLGLCTMGNIFSLIIFARERPNSSKNIYLGAICVANFVYMWSQMPFYLHNNFSTVRDTDFFRSFFWRSEGIWKFLIDLFVTFSDWVFIIISFERLIATCAPGSYSKRSDNGYVKAVAAVSGVFFGAAFYSLYNLIGYYWFHYHYSPADGTTAELPSTLQIWRHMQQLAIVCVPIGTYGLIFFINLLLVIFALIRRKNHASPFSIKLDSNRGDLTRIVAANFVLYLVCILPMFDLDILVLLNSFRRYDMPLTSRMYQIWYPIALYILNIYYSINFFIYVLASPNFRRTIRGISRSKRTKRPQSATGRLILAYPDRNSPGSGVFLKHGGLHPSLSGIKM